MSTCPVVTARQTLVVLVTICLAFGPGFAAPGAAPPGRAAMRGVLYMPDETHAMGGTLVTAVDLKTGVRFTSAMTREDGAFEIDGLDAGAYGIVIEAGAATFVADDLVELSAGQLAVLSLAVRPQRPAIRSVPGVPSPNGSAVPVAASARGTAAAAGARGAGRGRGFWESPVGLVLIDLLATGAVLVLANNVGVNKASPSTP